MGEENTLVDQVEALVDKHSLTDVLEAIRNVCLLKSDHLSSNWSNVYTAAWYEDVANEIDKISAPM